MSEWAPISEPIKWPEPRPQEAPSSAILAKSLCGISQTVDEIFVGARQIPPRCEHLLPVAPNDAAACFARLFNPARKGGGFLVLS